MIKEFFEQYSVLFVDPKSFSYTRELRLNSTQPGKHDRIIYSVEIVNIIFSPSCHQKHIIIIYHYGEYFIGLLYDTILTMLY